MDVHPSKNGINRYWSIPIYIYIPYFSFPVADKMTSYTTKWWKNTRTCYEKKHLRLFIQKQAFLACTTSASAPFKFPVIDITSIEKDIHTQWSRTGQKSGPWVRGVALTFLRNCSFAYLHSSGHRVKTHWGCLPTSPSSILGGTIHMYPWYMQPAAQQSPRPSSWWSLPLD